MIARRSFSRGGLFVAALAVVLSTTLCVVRQRLEWRPGRHPCC